jgi:predicted PurR-regulated permease PerM
VILAVIPVIALRAPGPILKPLMIAVFFCILISPIERLLVRIRVPRAAAYLLIFALVLAAGFFMGKLISLNVKVFSDELPVCEETAKARAARLSCPVLFPVKRAYCCVGKFIML